MPLRDVTIVRDETGDGVRVTSRTRSDQRFERKRRGSTFGARRREATLRTMGATRDGGQMNKTAEQDCVSPPYVETFN